jgi:hypothetical protein
VASFQFQITPIAGVTPADGFAFVIQNSSATALGTGGPQGCGGCLGYTGISNSLAIEFDTFPDISPLHDPDGNHIAIMSMGKQPNTADHSLAQLGTYYNPLFPLTDGNPHQVGITYSGGTLAVTVDGVPAVSTPVDVGSFLGLADGAAWVGFTGAAGAGGETAQISNWTFSPTF